MESIKWKKEERERQNKWMEGVEVLRCRSVTEGIAGMGYDALFEILEIETTDREVFWFFDVPEHIWYEWRSVNNPTAFFYTHIADKFDAKRIEQVREGR